MGVTCTICWCRIYCYYVFCAVSLLQRQFLEIKKVFLLCLSSPLQLQTVKRLIYKSYLFRNYIVFTIFSPPKPKTRRNVWRYQRSNNERTNNCDITTSTLLRLNGVPNMRRQSTLHINPWMGTCLVTGWYELFLSVGNNQMVNGAKMSKCKLLFCYPV